MHRLGTYLPPARLQVLQPYAVYNLIGLAGLFFMQGKALSITLPGTAEATSASPGLKIETELQDPYDQALAEGRQKDPSQEFQSAWEAGN